jgi:hypothetical protein
MGVKVDIDIVTTTANFHKKFNLKQKKAARAKNEHFFFSDINIGAELQHGDDVRMI